MLELIQTKQWRALNRLFATSPQLIGVVLENGQTILHYLVIHRFSAALDELIEEFEPNVNVQDDLGNTPLHYAALVEFNPRNYINPLINMGADCYIKNKKGQLPKDLVYGNRTTVVEWLT